MSNYRLLGFVAGFSYPLIWATWIVVTRLGVTTSLTAGDLSVLRFAVPTLILAPLLAGAARRAIGQVRPVDLVVMAIGAGAPMFLLSATGMNYAPAAHVGALLPGSMPLFVAIMSVLLLRERIVGARRLGFALILAGDFAIGGYAALVANDGSWRGHLMFLGASLLWAFYTLAFRRSGLTPWRGALLVNGISFVGFVPLYLYFADSRLFSVPWRELLLQTVIQGVGSGLAGLALYGLAVSRLGASRGAAFTSLTPVCATLLAIPILGEIPDFMSIAGIACVAFGVAMASGVFEKAP